MVELTQTCVGPEIAAGTAFTVSGLIVLQPVGSVYVIFVPPAAMPVTKPSELIVPAAGVLLVHVPPEGVDDKGVDAPTHTVLLPVITVGFGLTVTGKLTELVQPGPVVTV
jgi:hypothetical protein